MKAAAIIKTGEIRLIETDIPEPEEDQVLIKVAYCGICATDYDNYRGTTSFAKKGELQYPLRFGHEWSGVICRTGSKAHKFKVGDKVIGDGKVTCGKCKNCLSGRWYDCLHIRAVGTVKDHWPGGMAEYICMPERNVFKVDESVLLKEAAMCEPVTIAMNGLRETDFTDKTLLVIGSGPTGLGGVAAGRALGAGRIICAGRKDVKLQRALPMGADAVINITKTPLEEALPAVNDGRKADYVLETSGDMYYVENMLRFVQDMGTFSAVGFYNRPLNGFDVDAFAYAKMVFRGSSGSRQYTPVVLDLLNKGKMDLMPMLTHEISFEEIEHGMQIYEDVSRERIKMMVSIGGENVRQSI